jgi:plasmid stabilization system protein ParE
MTTPRNILFTFQSCADLNEIWEAIAMPRSPWSAYDSARLRAAERFAERFEKLCELLPKHPEIGVARDDLHAGLCSVPLGRYAIYYRTRGDSVEVLRVLRAAQDSGLAQSG